MADDVKTVTESDAPVSDNAPVVPANDNAPGVVDSAQSEKVTPQNPFNQHHDNPPANQENNPPLNSQGSSPVPPNTVAPTVSNTGVPIPSVLGDVAQNIGDRTISTTDPAVAQASVEAEIQRRVNLALEQQRSGMANSQNESTHWCRDANSDDFYGGDVSPELVKAFTENGNRPLFAMQRSVVVDQFGTRNNVWFPAPDMSITGPRPGEHRRVYLEAK